MVKRKILINTIDRVKEFNQKASNMNFDIDVASGRYTIDAKSIMGIFSLDVSKPLELICYVNDAADADVLLNDIAHLLV